MLTMSKDRQFDQCYQSPAPSEPSQVDRNFNN